MSGIRREITLGNLVGKTLAVDGFNVLYQVLFSIRDRSNRLLKNREGEVTSHLVGLFFKNVRLVESRITPVYCFDGAEKSRKIRRADREVQVTDAILSSAKELLGLMGIGWVQAPSEGEAQCVELTKRGLAWAVASQDYDVLLYGGKRLVRNLALASKEIEYVSLPKFLEHVGLTQCQLVDLSILIGNDYFPGVRGFGEKTALKGLRECGRIEDMALGRELELKDGSSAGREEFLERVGSCRALFAEPSVEKECAVDEGARPDIEGLKDFLARYDFDPKRTASSLKKLRDAFSREKQMDITSFFTPKRQD